MKLFANLLSPTTVMVLLGLSQVTPGVNAQTCPAANTAPSVVNIAVGKTATQSSLGWGGVPSRAVDGNTDGIYNKGSVMHNKAASDNQAWWQVDLGSSQAISSMQLFGRTDCCRDRLSKFYILVSDTDMTGKSLEDLLADDSIFKLYREEMVNVSDTFYTPTKGRFVRIQNKGAGFLQIAEAQIFANVAVGKKASQSSIGWGGKAERAVDGNTDGIYKNLSIMHTKSDKENQAWWEVDLGTSQALSQINLYGRTDCCSDRLSKFYILVSDKSMTGKSLDDLLKSKDVWNVYREEKVEKGGTAFDTPTKGRYIRIQNKGTGFLQITEAIVTPSMDECPCVAGYTKKDGECVKDRSAAGDNVGGSGGDPHFKTWSGHKYDFHGECDLVLLSNPSFANGLGMQLHIRTTRERFYSKISSAALKIGDDVLEFSNRQNWLLNGQVPEEKLNFLSGFKVRRFHKAISVRLDDKAEVRSKIDFIVRSNGTPYVVIDGGSTDNLKGSLGMIGDWETGHMLSRDKKASYEGDAEAFAREWQVRPLEDGNLFQSQRAPIYPDTCLMPEKMLGNRLGDARLKAAAEKACEAWGDDKEECIFDVMATQDIRAAEAPVLFSGGGRIADEDVNNDSPATTME